MDARSDNWHHVWEDSPENRVPGKLRQWDITLQTTELSIWCSIRGLEMAFMVHLTVGFLTRGFLMPRLFRVCGVLL